MPYFHKSMSSYFKMKIFAKYKITIALLYTIVRFTMPG